MAPTTRSAAAAPPAGASLVQVDASNLHAAMDSLRKRTPNSSPGPTEARKTTHEKTASEQIDHDGIFHEYEFGGPVGVVGMMTFFPCLFYYLWASLIFYDGKFAVPEDPSSLHGPGGWIDFASTIVGLVRTHAAPTQRAATLYLSLMALQLFLAFTMPGLKQQGLPVSSLGGRTLTYHCNAYASFYATLAIVFAAHYYEFFNLAEVIDLYGQLLTVASISGFTLAGVIYAFGQKYRMSGNFFYDYFMGSTLNPRIGTVDIKMWAEIRISWTLLIMIALSGVVKQYQAYGYVSPNILLFTWGVFMYTNSCAKGEHCIPQTWDMNYEKFGWLLSYWNFAGVPFSYAYPAVYMATHDPATYRYPTWFISLLFVILTSAYVVFDLANGQKSSFKADQTGTFIQRYTFPQFPGTHLKNPTILRTKRGPLLVSGLWGIVRKPNYTSDSIQAWCWALSAGTNSKIVYFYPVFHLTMLLHRNARDDARCARKYGDDWIAYQKLVPYSFIPYLY